jgi:hypothetical protein
LFNECWIVWQPQKWPTLTLHSVSPLHTHWLFHYKSTPYKKPTKHTQISCTLGFPLPNWKTPLATYCLRFTSFHCTVDTFLCYSTECGLFLMKKVPPNVHRKTFTTWILFSKKSHLPHLVTPESQGHCYLPPDANHLHTSLSPLKTVSSWWAGSVAFRTFDSLDPSPVSSGSGMPLSLLSPSQWLHSGQGGAPSVISILGSIK